MLIWQDAARRDVLSILARDSLTLTSLSQRFIANDISLSGEAEGRMMFTALQIVIALFCIGMAVDCCNAPNDGQHRGKWIFTVVFLGMATVSVMAVMDSLGISSP